MGFGDTFDPAGMLAYSNQLQEMKFRNKLYEMQYSKQERDEHEKSLINASQLKAAQEAARIQKAADDMAYNPGRGGVGASGEMSPSGESNPMRVGPTVANSRGLAIGQMLKGLGLSEPQVAGSLGGLSMETTGFDPNAINPKSGAFGIGQWLGPRLTGLQTFAAKQGKPINDFDTQKNYLEYELKTGEKGAFAAVQGSGTAKDAVNAWTDKFERSDATPDLRSRGLQYAQNMAGESSTMNDAMRIGGNPNRSAYAWANGMIKPGENQNPMSPQGQHHSDPMQAFAATDDDTPQSYAGKIMARDEYIKNQQFVQQQQQGVLSNAAPSLAETMQIYSKKNDNTGKDSALDSIAAMYQGKPNSEMVMQRINELKKVDVSGPQGTFAFEGEVTPATLQLARDMKVPPQIMSGLQGSMGKNLKMSFENNQLKEWDTTTPKDVGKTGDVKNETTFVRAKKALIEGGNPNPTEDEITKKVNTMTTEVKTAEQEAKAAGIDVPGLVDSMSKGDLATYQATGSMSNPVKTLIESGVHKKYPNFDFTKLDANAKWDSNPGNQRTQSMIEGALPRVAMLDDQVQKLGNTQIPIVNRAKELTKTELGSADYTNFNSNRNAIVQEINTALSGSAQSSDMRIKIELENIKAARSPAQLHGAINNLNEALLSRMDSTMNPRWPIEVVRGEKTVPEYTKEIISKYRGKFGTASEKNEGQPRTADDLYKKHFGDEK